MDCLLHKGNIAMFKGKSFLSALLLCLFSSAVNAQSVTILHGSADAQDCSYTARLVSSNPSLGSIYSESSCTRALEQEELYTLRDIAALHINRGIILAGQEDYQAAFADYKTALDIKPSLPETYVNLGNLYFLGDNFDKAIEFYDKSLELGISKRHAAYLNRGMAHEKQGELDLAEVDYMQALTLMPEWQLALDKMARLQAKIEDSK